MKKNASVKLSKRERARIARRTKNDGLNRIALGNAVRAAADGLSRDDMAALTKDAASQMSRVMTGHDDEFSADRLVKMLARLGRQVTLLIQTGRGRPYIMDYTAGGRRAKVTRGAR